MSESLFKSKGLTSAESKVAELTAKGLRSKETASFLGVTEKTVKFHLTKIYKKLGVNRHTLVKDFGRPTTIDQANDKAVALLMEVVTRGRNQLPYKEQLDELKVALEVSPEIKKAILESLG